MSIFSNFYKKFSRDFSTAILQSALKALAFFVFLYAIDAIFRALFILNLGILERHLGSAESAEFLQAFVNGARYFGQIAGVLSSVIFVLFLFNFRRICFIFIALVISLICFVNIANMGFYAIYGDVFNANLLGLVFDDRSAIFATAQGGQYNLILKIITFILSSIIFVLIFYKIIEIISRFCAQNLARISQNIRRICAFLAFVIFVFSALFAINGHFGLKGISLGAEIRPTTNAFLRKISTGAFRDLYLVFRAYKKITNSKFSDFIDEAPRLAAQNFAKREIKCEIKGEINVLDLLKKRVGGGQSQNPQNLSKTSPNSQNLGRKSQNLAPILRNSHESQNLGEKSHNPQNLAQNPQINHIFYIIAESMSEWHFDDVFDEIELSSELKKLVRENGAHKAQTFIQNAGSTIASLNVQISGLLQTDIPLSLLGGKVRDLKTAPAVIMRDLGFEGSFFYGGSGTWQKLDSYVTTQGFSEILFATHIIENAKSKAHSTPLGGSFENSWGVYDNYLFEFISDRVSEKVRQNPRARTFNMIMTTSNHPPYNAPVAEFGAPLAKIEKFIETHKDLRKKPITARLLAHIWWQDKLIAKFVREMSAKLPNSLFVITGDHYDREYPFAPSLRVSQSVPFIVYAPNVALEARANIGAHIDITPTIVEIVAPRGYEYHSFGKPLVGRVDSATRAKNAESANKNNLSLRADSQNLRGNPKDLRALRSNQPPYDSALFSQSGLPRSHSLARNDENVADSAIPKQKDAEFAFGFGVVATTNFLFDGFNIEYFNGVQNEADKTLAQEYFKHLQRARAISWWILQKGWVIE